MGVEIEGMERKQAKKQQANETVEKIMGLFDRLPEKIMVAFIVVLTMAGTFVGTTIYKDHFEPGKTERAVDTLSNYHGTQYVQVVTDAGNKLTIEKQPLAGELSKARG